MQVLANPKNELPRVILASGFSGKGFAIHPINLDPLFNRLAEFPINLSFIISMDASEHQSGTSADIALILFRPFDDLQISVTRFHSITSRTAFSTERS
ncbi:MAG TPA: hypothetical protein PK907_09400 [Candidatus Sabulitectum sp.]|nr:hypothetical protein [Candidatus Sabulitectum sp.]